MELSFDSIASLVAAAESEGRPLSALVLEQQAAQLERSEADVYETMHASYEVMRTAAAEGLKPGVRSASGLTGGDARRLHEHLQTNGSLIGGLLPQAMATALAVSEWNAAMGRIVATPTAGSCGILPGALLTMETARGVPQRACVMSLFTAAAVGMVIAENASVSGAQGGCQAECGSASAMAAAALVELAGGTPAQMAHAVAIALKNILGLVCDPVAGLVEIPCEKRNASGVANAFAAAELALAGVESAIPADEVIDAMRRVGETMPPALRETAEGGLAATPTGRSLFAQVFGEKAPGGGAACGACGKASASS